MEKLIFLTMLVMSLTYFIIQIRQRYKYVRLGKPENRSDNPPVRWKYLFRQLFFHEKIREYPLSGLFHWPIFWGFIVLMFSSLDLALSFLFNVRLPIFNSAWFLFVRDTFIVLVIFGVTGFILRRFFFKPDWLHNSFKAYGILLLILIIVLTEGIYLTAEAVLNPAGQNEAAWLVYFLTQHFPIVDRGLLLGLIKVNFWAHFLAMFSFLYVIPHTKHLHMLFAPINIYRRSLKPSGHLVAAALDQEDCGSEVVEDFTWKHLLDAFSCVMCGRCHGVCPGERSLERLKPKKINGRLRTYMEEEGRLPKRLPASKRKSLKVVGDLFHDDFIWSCTTCGSCNQACPVSIDHLGKIIEMRRNMVAKNKYIPPEIASVFSNLAKTGNLLGFSPGKGTEGRGPGLTSFSTVKDKPAAEYLLYLGCQARYSYHCRPAGLALAKLLAMGGVSFAVMGEEETCCGETVRRMGNEALFQQVARKNITRWNQLGVRKVITGCPHCYNTLKNEYPDFGGDYEVVHYTTVLLELLTQGRLTVAKEFKKAVTYHDPCYLGKHNGIVEEPRAILAAAGVRLLEMSRTKTNAFCCGGGGGRYWINSSFPNPIKSNRITEALSTQGEVIVTACPYCNLIFSEEIKKNRRDSQVEVLDLALLMAQVVE